MLLKQYLKYKRYLFDAKKLFQNDTILLTTLSKSYESYHRIKKGFSLVYCGWFIITGIHSWLFMFHLLYNMRDLWSWMAFHETTYTVNLGSLLWILSVYKPSVVLRTSRWYHYNHYNNFDVIRFPIAEASSVGSYLTALWHHFIKFFLSPFI